MNHNNFHTIDPSQSHLPDSAVIQKVLSDNDRLSTEQHEQAVRAFFVSDGIASGIGKDLAFVDQIPNFIKEIIDHKLWECLYVAKGVVTPYYCCYTKGTDSENFRAFISAKRPNGLETSIETIDRVLQADPEVQRKFRAIIYESRQGQRTDLLDETSDSDYPKLDENLQSAQQKRIRAANRAAEAIPVIGELLDRSLIAIDVAALLGRDIKDPKNLTAEEREYVDKRDLIGLRINQYIYTNPIPEDEDKEPAYSRELNNYVKDLLGIKDRSKSVRMDNPKRAAEKLLQFYQGDKLQELITNLRQGLNVNADSQEPAREHSNSQNSQYFSELTPYQASVTSTEIENANGTKADENQPVKELQTSNSSLELTPYQSSITFTEIENANGTKADENQPVKELQTSNSSLKLTSDELAERLQVKSDTLRSMYNRDPHKFSKWTKKHDPHGWAWQRSEMKKGRCWLFIPIKEVK